MSDIKLSEHIKTNTEYKIKSYTFFGILILILIGFLLMIGKFGPDFFALLVFLLIFSIPVILLFRNKLTNILPEFISKNLLEIDNSKTKEKKIKFSISKYVKEVAIYIMVCILLIGSGILIKNANSDFTDKKCMYKILGAVSCSIIAGIVLLEIDEL